jgi:hypothetical protein
MTMLSRMPVPILLGCALSFAMGADGVPSSTALTAGV